MRRNVKIKTAASRVPLRKASITASALSRRAFPAWIDAADGSAFSAVVPRVRDGLVLRRVSKLKPATARNLSDRAGPL